MTEDQINGCYKKAEELYEAGDLVAAVEIFMRLANAGDYRSCFNLGFIYKIGDGVVKNTITSEGFYFKGIRLLTSLSAEGSSSAMLVLGKIYQYGDNINKDHSKALSLINKSAAIGNSDAMFHLACIYLNGWCGQKHSREEYRYWLNEAVRADHPEALFTEGLRLISMHSKSEDGLSLIKRAAEHGFWPAVDYLNG